MSVVIWFAPWPPVRESRVRIRSPHQKHQKKFSLVWVFFKKKRYSSTSGLLSFNKPEKVLWTIAKIIIIINYILHATLIVKVSKNPDSANCSINVSCQREVHTYTVYIVHNQAWKCQFLSKLLTMKTFVTFLLLVLVVVDGQKKSNEYVSIFKCKHLFPVHICFLFTRFLNCWKRGCGRIWFF